MNGPVLFLHCEREAQEGPQPKYNTTSLLLHKAKVNMGPSLPTKIFGRRTMQCVFSLVPITPPKK